MVASTMVIIVGVAVPHALADDIDQVRKLRSTESILPLSQILKNIKTTFPGTLLDVELEYEEGRFVYEIEILGHDRRIQHLEVDARTGKLLTGEND
jgi:uncharacterized membrane protein YkoI